MRAFSTAVVAASALLGAIASPHDRRGHNELAKRMEGNVEKRGAFTNARFTWYPTDTGADACTGKNHQDDSWVVALNMPLFGESGNGHCGKQIKITYNGKSTVATIADACATCYSDSDIDLTKGLFEFFDGNLGDGVFYGTWEFVDGSDSGSDSPPPPPKNTPKPTPKPSPKPTPAPETPKVEKVTQKPSSSKPKPSSHSSVHPSSVSVSHSVSASHAAPSVIPSVVPSVVPPYVAPAAAEDTPNVPVNAGAEPSETAQLQGGIGNNGPLSGAAVSLSFNQAALAITAIAAIALQAL